MGTHGDQKRASLSLLKDLSHTTGLKRHSRAWQRTCLILKEESGCSERSGLDLQV